MLSRTDDLSSLGAFLYSRRKRYRLTSYEVAQDLGFGRSQYSGIENNNYPVGIEVIRRLADYYIVEVSELVRLHRQTWGFGPSGYKCRKPVPADAAPDVVQRHRIKYDGLTIMEKESEFGG